MALETKYNLSVNEIEFKSYCGSLKNKVYKLLPLKEEELEWQKYLNTILVEVSGNSEIFIGLKDKLIALVGKLEGLYTIEDFTIYRSTIFECLGLIETIGSEAHE